MLESRAVSAEARADGLVLSLDAKEQEVRESERRAEVEKRVLLEKIRALEGRDTASAARLSEVAGELGTLRGADGEEGAEEARREAGEAEAEKKEREHKAAEAAAAHEHEHEQHAAPHAEAAAPKHEMTKEEALLDQELRAELAAELGE